jgi:RIO kinase 1
MRVSDTLAALVDEGVLDDVIRPLAGGKEAQVYLVVAGGEECVAKVYKEAQDRSFQARAAYTEGRKVRNTRDQRAMQKRSRYGRAQDEAAWRSTEVDMIYLLRDAGVRVPKPYHFVDGVLIMELVRGHDGHPAPRLGDLVFSRDQATQIFERLLTEVVRMLHAGVIHGDLSEFNVLMASDGPVIIDLPQAVNAARNQNARRLLMRDIDNLGRFVERFAPGRRALPYAQELWKIYERGELTPTTVLTGRHVETPTHGGTHLVMGLIADAAHDERRRRQTLGMSMRGLSASDRGGERPPVSHHAPRQAPTSPGGGSVAGHTHGQAAPSARRRRRRRRGRGRGPAQSAPR